MVRRPVARGVCRDNQSITVKESGEQHTIKPFILIALLLIHIIINQCKNDGIVLWLAGAVLI